MNRLRKILVASSRLAFVLLILLLAFAYAMFQGGQVSWTIFYMVLPFACYSILLFFYPLHGLTADRFMRTSNVHAGGKVEVCLQLKRRFRFPLLYTIVSECWPVAQDNFLKKQRPKHVFIFGFREKLEWQYEIEQLPRGEHKFEGIQVEVVDFFGWMRKTQFIPLENAVLVYPKTTDIRLLSVGGQKDGGRSTPLFNVMKDTTIVTGARDYQPGDRMSWVHWKSFARTQQLMTKEFEDQGGHEVALLFDRRPSDTFEGQVELAASILKEAFRRFGHVRFLSTGSEGRVFPDIMTAEQQRQAFIHLAKMHPEEDAEGWLMGRYGMPLHKSGNLMIVTGSPDDRFVERISSYDRGSRIVVFVVLSSDRAARAPLLEDIRRARMRGVVIHAVTQDRLGAAFEEVTHL